MNQVNYKVVIEDTSKNKYMFYHLGTSLHCTEISKDRISKDTIVTSEVTDNFLVTIDLQDNIYAVCTNYKKGICILSYCRNEWRTDQILNIQSSGSIYLLSLFIHNNTVHIIYARQMTIASFYNIQHLYKTSINNNTPNPWRKNNVCELYAEKLDSSYSSIITKDGAIHFVNEWYDGSNYLINYCSYDNNADNWKRKHIATLFKKDILVNILYDDGYIHMFCYSYDDNTSVIFYYYKKDGSPKDFEFSFLEKIETEEAISPCFFIEGEIIYMSWIFNNIYYQYALNREQKNWSKKLSTTIPSLDILTLIEYQRNRKGRSIIVKKNYYTIDSKYNLNVPYLKDTTVEKSFVSEHIQQQNAEEGTSVNMAYLLNEIKALSSAVKTLNNRLEQMHSKTNDEHIYEPTKQRDMINQNASTMTDATKLKKSNFKDQFMNSNKLLSRPEATALYVGSSELPNPEQLSKKEGIEFVANDIPITPPTVETTKPTQDTDVNPQKDANLFKKLGDFFK